MRTSIILLFVTALCVTTAHAQNVPEHVKTIFSKSYPNAKKVKWDREDGMYEASFHMGGQKTSILYTTNGDVKETETEIATKELPAKAVVYAEAKGTIKEAAKIVAQNGTITYEAEVNGMDLLFDAQGNLIKEDSDSDKD